MKSIHGIRIDNYKHKIHKLCRSDLTKDIPLHKLAIPKPLSTTNKHKHCKPRHQNKLRHCIEKTTMVI